MVLQLLTLHAILQQTLHTHTNPHTEREGGRERETVSAITMLLTFLEIVLHALAIVCCKKNSYFDDIADNGERTSKRPQRMPTIDSDK